MGTRLAGIGRWGICRRPVFATSDRTTTPGSSSFLETLEVIDFYSGASDYARDPMHPSGTGSPGTSGECEPNRRDELVSGFPESAMLPKGIFRYLHPTKRVFNRVG
jgi:hypothetical protein